MSTTTPVRRQGSVAAILLAAAALAWAFLAWAVLDMGSPLARLMMPASAAWDVGTAAAVVLMWSVMMAAMMLPSAVPMILTFAQLAQRGGSRAATWAFAGAYVVAWAAFSAIAAAVHWLLQTVGLVSPMMVSTSPVLTAGLLFGAGVYQFTPLKSACLTRCRSPLAFLMEEWRKGTGGAFVMGLRHGMYCVGCCWTLMALLFAVGVMNLPLVAALALAVALEKLAPKGEWIARTIGFALIAGAAWVLLGLNARETGMRG
jgi:predicted metal-binding membrane protein